MTLYPNGTKNKPAIGGAGGKFGAPRPNGRTHEGTDFIGYTKIFSVIAGIVTWAGFFNNGAGYAVVYEGRDPVNGDWLEIRHFHTASSGIQVRKGDNIPEGKWIANQGKTGNATGNCDHVEIRKGRGGQVINSETWLDSRVNYKPAPQPAPAPADAGGSVAGVLGPNPFGIAYTGGLQKIAKLYGYTGKLDQNWISSNPNEAANSGSMKGFVEFLRRNYGYVGNNVLGPVMWSAIARWLRAKWGYVGNDTPGPVMRAALLRADTENWKAL